MKNTQADSWTSKNNQYAKQRKNRLERRRAKKHPDCHAQYGRYKGWLS